MTTMNVSLPEEMKAFVDEQITSGGYSTASEYIRELVREAQKRVAREKLETLLLEGLNSGPGVEATPQFWDDLRRRVKARVEAKNAKKQ